MKVTVSVSKKALIVIGVLCMLGIGIFLGFFAVELHKTKDYIKVPGVIVSIDRQIQYGKKNDQNAMIVKYVNCNYKVNDEIYKYRFRTFFSFGKKNGSTITIYCDQFHPENVRNNFLIESSLCGIVFLILFMIFLGVLIRHAS